MSIPPPSPCLEPERDLAAAGDRDRELVNGRPRAEAGLPVRRLGERDLPLGSASSAAADLL